jgi:hypothetical protein
MMTVSVLGAQHWAVFVIQGLRSKLLRLEIRDSLTFTI